VRIDKKAIVNALRDLGEGGQAERADAELPDTLDTDGDRLLFERFGIEPSALLDEPRAPRDL
jgi:hypothetical protein